MLLKASRVTNLTDARYFAAQDVDYLGFNLEEGTEGYLDPMYMKAIREWVTGPLIVGEFSRLPVAHVAAAAEFFGLEMVQLSAAHQLADLSDLSGVEIILQVDARLDKPSIKQIFQNAAPFVSCFLLNFFELDTWEAILYENIDFWNECFDLRPTLLEANVSAGQLSELFSKTHLAGLSIVGGDEEQVGIKSFDQIDMLLETIRG